MQISIANVIQVARRIGAAAAEVITTNLKMWLGFETSETLGRELNDLTWVDNGGWTINGDIASNDGSGSTLTNTILEIGKTYQFKCKLSSYTSGTFRLLLGANTISTSFNGTDEFTFIGVCAGDGDARVQSLSGIGSLSISSLSIKELTQITPDKSGNNNVGELFTGKALDFGGSVDKVDVLNYAYDINCVVFWINPLSTAINQNFIWFGGTNRGIKDIKLDNDLVRTQGLFGVSVTVNNVSTNTVNLNEWSRVVVTFNQITTTQISFGYGGTLYADILLSDIQVFSTQWSADDISYDYANPQNFITEREGTSITANDCKGYWHLSEGSGNICYDTSKEGNNGVISGATYVDAQPRIPQLGIMNWSKGSNLFSYSQDFSQWTKEATVTLTPNYGTSPSGANDSTRIQMNANDSLYLSNAGSSKTFSIYVKGTQSETIRLSNGVTALFTLTGDWDRIQLYDTSGASVLYSFNTYSGATARDMEIWGGQLEDSSSASAYRLTDGAATLNSTVIPDLTTPTKDIFGNAVRDRLNSFNLDGTGYAEVADDTDLDFGTGDFTLECWAKYDFLDQSSSWNVLVSNGSISSSGGSGFSLASSISSFSIRLNAGTAVTKSFGTDNMTVGNWYHLVVTREGTSLKTYRDTSLKNSSTIISVDVDTSLPVRIGRDTNTDRFYQNLISDVRLYDRALTSDEIEDNYNAGLSAHTN